MRKTQLIAKRPAYHNGQLLLADDFIAEQKFHVHAGDRHSLNLHGWGVVRGLEVTRASDSAVHISPGYAIDGRGREIELRQGETLELQGVQANSQLSVSIGHRVEAPGQEKVRMIECLAVLLVAGGIEEHDVMLATLQIDDRGRLGLDGIGTASRRSLQAAYKGWLRMPFRPIRIPEDQKNAPPPYRVGATQAVAHTVLDGKPNLRGAGGTMAIVLPPQVTGVHRLRVAGAANHKLVSVILFKGLWDPRKLSLAKVELVKEIVEGKADAGAFDRKWAVAPELAEMDPECSTLSLEVRSEAYAAISLVALEVSY